MKQRFTFRLLAALVLAALITPCALAGKSGGGSTSRIAYIDWGGGGGMVQVFLINPDGSGKVQLTNETSKQHMCPAWSPDGTKISTSIALAGVGLVDLKVIDVATGSYIEYPHVGGGIRANLRGIVPAQGHPNASEKGICAAAM